MQSPYGKVLDEVPADFVHPEVWPEFGAMYQPVAPCAREEVGKDPRGIRWSLWPITFEEYVGDDEPRLEDADHGPLARFRAVAWKRIRRTDTPAGWRTLSKRPWSLEGICRIAPGEDYTKLWRHSGQRDLGRWQKHTDAYSIETISFDEYKTAYKKSTVGRRMGEVLLSQIERSLVSPVARENLRLWGVRNRTTGAVVAGLAAVYSPTYHASMYRVPFILPEMFKTYAMTGLVDHWFSDAQKNGIRMQIFTHFWQPGEPRSWKGSSEFKSHFIQELVAFPPTLWRWRGGKIY